MPDDNQTQTTNDTPAPEITDSVLIDQSIPPTDSVTSDVPPEPQNGPQDTFTMSPNKDQNEAVNPTLDVSSGEAEQEVPQTEAQNEPISESPQVTEAENPVASQNQTPQTSTFEPLASNNHMSELLEKEHEAINNKRQKRLDSIMTLFAKQTNNDSTDSPRVTNDEVEKFLHVSNATVIRYLSILKKENKIIQNGKTGKSVYYTQVK